MNKEHILRWLMLWGMEPVSMDKLLHSWTNDEFHYNENRVWGLLELWQKPHAVRPITFGDWGYKLTPYALQRLEKING